MKQILYLLLLIFGFATGVKAQNEAYSVELTGANSENTSTLRSITYSYDEETKIYTFNGLLEVGANVEFKITNENSIIHNITFCNGTEAPDSPFTWKLPNANGDSKILIAVLSHQDYNNANLRSFQTGFDGTTGYIVVLNGSRSKILKVVKFGIGKHGEEEIPEVPNIAAFKALAQSSKLNLGYNTPAKVYKITGPVTCIIDYVLDNTWYYVQDETGTLAINSNHSYPLGTHNYKAGDVLIGITGYSVGTNNDGYYMDLDAERFFVHDNVEHDANKEITKFPSASGKAKIIPPTTIRYKSEVTRSMNFDYVVLKGFKFEKGSTGTIKGTHYLKDPNGGKFELSFDYVTIPPADSKSEAVNLFLNNVEDGYSGDFIGFISNNTRSFMIHSWGMQTQTCSTPKLLPGIGTYKFSCTTEDATIHYTITAPFAAEGTIQAGKMMPLETSPSYIFTSSNATSYTISYYATAPGYEPSEAKTYTFNKADGDVNLDKKVTISDIASTIALMLPK